MHGSSITSQMTCPAPRQGRGSEAQRLTGALRLLCGRGHPGGRRSDPGAPPPRAEAPNPYMNETAYPLRASPKQTSKARLDYRPSHTIQAERAVRAETHGRRERERALAGSRASLAPASGSTSGSACGMRGASRSSWRGASASASEACSGFLRCRCADAWWITGFSFFSFLGRLPFFLGQSSSQESTTPIIAALLKPLSRNATVRGSPTKLNAAREYGSWLQQEVTSGNAGSCCHPSPP